MALGVVKAAVGESIPSDNGGLTFSNNPNGQRGVEKCQKCREIKQKVNCDVEITKV